MTSSGSPFVRVREFLVYGVAWRSSWRWSQAWWAYVERLGRAGQNKGLGDDVRTSGELPLLRRVLVGAPARALVLDIGANLGEWGATAKRARRDLDVVAFEPQIELASPPGVWRVVCALSDRVDKVRMVRGVSGDPCAQVSPWGGYVVDAMPLDVWMREHRPGQAVFFMKLDVEGHELEVLRGARETLRRTTHVQVEVGHTRLEDVAAVLPGWACGRVLKHGALCPVPDVSREGTVGISNYVFTNPHAEPTTPRPAGRVVEVLE